MSCWPGSGPFGLVEVARTEDGAQLLSSRAAGCGTPAHPTFVDAFLETPELVRPTRAPTRAPTRPRPPDAPTGKPHVDSDSDHFSDSDGDGDSDSDAKRPSAPSPRPARAPAPRPTIAGATTRAPTVAAASGGSRALPDDVRVEVVVVAAALALVALVACAAVGLACAVVWRHHKAERDRPTWRDVERAIEAARNPLRSRTAPAEERAPFVAAAAAAAEDEDEADDVEFASFGDVEMAAREVSSPSRDSVNLDLAEPGDRDPMADLLGLG